MIACTKHLGPVCSCTFFRKIFLCCNNVYYSGQEIIPAAKAQLPVSQEEAARNTIAYSILSAHNTSGNMDKLQIKFDKLTSHDITFVGIIQTARASGLERFPVPYVLTNCHNSLCAVGGTINEDDHMFGLTCALPQNPGSTHPLP